MLLKLMSFTVLVFIKRITSYRILGLNTMLQRMSVIPCENVATLQLAVFILSFGLYM